jgi:hypothetical protein
MPYSLNLSGVQHAELYAHLFPGDNREAVALALCGRLEHKCLTRFVVHKVLCIPHDECEREPRSVKWPVAKYAGPLLSEAQNSGFALLKIHSHPDATGHFSNLDDIADADLFGSAHHWFDDQRPHVSAVMLPDGEIFGRVHRLDTSTMPLDKVMVVGDQIRIWEPNTPALEVTASGLRNAQAFGEGTYQILRRLKVGVVGCSGTGSPVIEQLGRLNVGELVLVDPDSIEDKNLNRIINSTAEDAKAKRRKVDVLGDAVERMGYGTIVHRFADNLYDSKEALLELASCDVLIGCMDSVDGRDLLNQLATYYVQPYFDMGVRLNADDYGGIRSITGVVHYIQPGRSSLLTRHLYDEEDLKSAHAYRVDPEGHADRVKNDYFKDVPVNRPAVLPVNMYVAAAGVCELLNRLHPFRVERFEASQLSLDLTENYVSPAPESFFDVDEYRKRCVGLGTTPHFLGLMLFQP